jgi:hypothetical protein
MPDKKPDTCTVETLSNILSNTAPDQPVYIICDGRRYQIIEIKTRVLHRVELHAAPAPVE